MAQMNLEGQNLLHKEGKNVQFWWRNHFKKLKLYMKKTMLI